MDNLSHSLLGLAVGELVQRSVAAEPSELAQRTRRRMALFACWAASNFPDLDLVLTRMLPAPIGYLLHHRGHTHTLLYLLPQAALLLALIWLCWPGARALLRASASARRVLAIGMASGLLLHLLLDSFNSYGIHPFHPFDARWLYGDAVFILEPVFWVAFGAPLAAMLARRFARLALYGAMSMTLAFFTLKGFLSWPALALLLPAGAALAALQRAAGPQRRHALVAALLAGAGYVTLQAGASHYARAQLSAQLIALDPATDVRDIALNAYPANPACWNYVAVERLDARASFRLRRGTLNLGPLACPAALVQQAWSHETSLATLQARRRDSCWFDAWLRFARAPLLGRDRALDARFGIAAQDNLASFDYAEFAGMPCPQAIPPWGYPRADLLR